MALGQEASSQVCIWPHWVAMVVVLLLQVELVVCSLVYCRAVRRARAEGSNCKKTKERENIQVKLRHETLEGLRYAEGRRRGSRVWCKLALTTASSISSAL